MNIIYSTYIEDKAKMATIEIPYNRDTVGIIRQVFICSKTNRIEYTDGYKVDTMGFYHGDIQRAAKYLLGKNMLDISLQKFKEAIK